MPDKARYAQRMGWKREGKTFLMVNKEGFQRRMDRAETNFYKECDRIEQEKATRRKAKEEVRERRTRKYQERQEKQDKRREDYLASIKTKRTLKDRSGEDATVSSPKQQKPAENSNEEEAGEDQTPEEKQAKERYWAQPEVKKLTIRMLTTMPGVTLSRQDIGHINKNHLR